MPVFFCAVIYKVLENWLLANRLYINTTNQTPKDMKAQLKLTAGIAVATIAVLIASQSVNQAATENRKHKFANHMAAPAYSSEDVQLLMDANHWSKERAVKVLELSAQNATNIKSNKTPRDHE